MTGLPSPTPQPTPLRDRGLELFRIVTQGNYGEFLRAVPGTTVEGIKSTIIAKATDLRWCTAQDAAPHIETLMRICPTDTACKILFGNGQWTGLLEHWLRCHDVCPTSKPLFEAVTAALTSHRDFPALAQQNPVFAFGFEVCAIGSAQTFGPQIARPHAASRADAVHMGMTLGLLAPQNFPPQQREAVRELWNHHHEQVFAQLGEPTTADPQALWAKARMQFVAGKFAAEEMPEIDGMVQLPVQTYHARRSLSDLTAALRTLPQLPISAEAAIESGYVELALSNSTRVPVCCQQASDFAKTLPEGAERTYFYERIAFLIKHQELFELTLDWKTISNPTCEQFRLDYFCHSYGVTASSAEFRKQRLRDALVEEATRLGERQPKSPRFISPPALQDLNEKWEALLESLRRAPGMAQSN